MTTVSYDPGVASATRVGQPVAAIVVALASLVSAAIHLFVVPEHLEEWWVFAVFFVVVAAGQVVSASLVLWWRRTWLLLAVLGANVAVVMVWVVSRTSGLPFGPPILDMTGGLADPARGGYGTHAVGLPEPVGLLDLSSTVLELLVVVALVSLLAPVWRRRTCNLLCLGGLLLWSLYLVGVLG